MAQVTPKGWSSTERRTDAGAVFFQQVACPPRPAVPLSEAGARELAERYWDEIETFTRGLVQARKRDDCLELRLLGSWTLLSFGRPETFVDSVQATSRFPILGGALARTPGGSISFSQAISPELELRTTVDAFVPRLGTGNGSRGWTGTASWKIERRLHVAISRRYLARLVEQAAG